MKWLIRVSNGSFDRSTWTLLTCKQALTTGNACVNQTHNPYRFFTCLSEERYPRDVMQSMKWHWLLARKYWDKLDFKLGQWQPFYTTSALVRIMCIILKILRKVLLLLSQTTTETINHFLNHLQDWLWHCLSLLFLKRISQH